MSVPSQPLVSTLPSQSTRFIGREEDLARVRALLAEPSCRMVTLVGSGGIGKTRLAVQTAMNARDQFTHGVHFFNLLPVASGELLAAALADGLRLTQYDDPLAKALHYLQERACLLILDNFEHLLDEIDVLVAILDGAPQTKLLVTSREVLNLRQEWVWPVTGMAFPDSDHIESAQDFSAVQLFFECARRVRPDFSLADEQAAVIRICQLVQGMPLAIELAASWLKLLPCADIAAEIQRSLDFLNTSLRDVPERHRSIRAVFDHSWEMLNAQEQAVFRRLSVFRGGFLREAAEQAAGASLAVLSGLVDKSLIWREHNGRYQIHELLHQYAEEQLNEDAEEVRRVYDTHAIYYMDFLRRRESELHSKRQRETIGELEAELDNVRAAWQRTVAEANFTAIQAGGYIYYEICDMRGRYRESVDAAERAIEHLTSIEASDQRDFTLAGLYVQAGASYIRLGQFEAARIVLQRSIAIYRDLGARPSPGFGREPASNLGLLFTTIGDHAQAVKLCEEDLQRIEATDKLNRTFTLYVLATASYSLEQYQAAFEYAHQSYAITQECGDKWFGSYVLVVMGDIAWAVEDYDRARQYYQTSYRLKEDFNELGGMAFALNRMAFLAWIRGDYAEAERLYQQAYDLYRDVDDPGGSGMSLFGLGDSAQAQGNYATARRYFLDALGIAARIRWPQLILTILVGVGDLLLRSGEQEQAVELLALVAQHPASEPPARKRARALLGRAPEVKTDEIQELDAVIEFVRPLFNQPRSDAPRIEKPQQGLFEPLSERELEILRLLADGLTNDEIAERLTLVVGTVKAHNHHIFGKLGVKNRVQAIRRARELGLV